MCLCVFVCVKDEEREERREERGERREERGGRFCLDSLLGRFDRFDRLDS